MAPGSPEAELKKALSLDPNDAEAWMWLGNVYQDQNRLQEALAAHSRAVEIEPMWDVAIGNKIGNLFAMKDWRGIDSEVKRVAAMGDPVRLAKTRIRVAAMAHRPADAINLMLELRIAHPEEASWVDTRIFHPLMQLGFIEEAFTAWNWPIDQWAGVYRGVPIPADVIKREIHDPRTGMWEPDDESMALFGRLLPKRGRLKEYLGFYDAAFKTPSELFDYTEESPDFFISTAPSLAANLRAAGRDSESNAILHHAEELLQPRFSNGLRNPGDLGLLARIRGAEGRDDDAVSLLRQATLGGDLPDRRFQASDIADEPCFARLVNRADFQAIRKSILARIDQERRKVSLVLLARSHLQPIRRAA